MKAGIFSIATGLLPRVAAVPAPSVEARDKAAIASVTIASGTIIGTAGEAVETFNGIPYADPPVGDLRFRPPVKLSRTLARLLLPASPFHAPRGPSLL